MVGFNLAPLFSNRNRTQFHVTCYSNVTQPDQSTETFRRLSDEWRPIVGRNEAEIAELITRDRIDILVDLSLHMDRNSLLVSRARLSPGA